MHVWIRSPSRAAFPSVGRFAWPGDETYDTSLADSHPATERHRCSRLLPGFEKCCRTVDRDGLPDFSNVTVPPSAGRIDRVDTANRSICSRSSMPSAFHTSFDLVEHRQGSAGPGLTLTPIRAHLVEERAELAVAAGELDVADEILVLLVQCREFVGEHHVGFRGRGVDVHDVGN